ncbi:PEP/pyruvate-binding domain-containing protein [Desulfobacter vibrioformis]|uniref:PEP/pyruvate-binding domain-containing protein n=1 Tax=Desulfobacter vibrioformis TaxID=34031 RepID=UPI00055595FA|nr:PEP/pyruvate-binding domain-containing protein [Desulfobacter vibrioformis]
MKTDDTGAETLSIKIYHELMAYKVADILLVSSPYDAFIMEEEGRLSNRIINQYRGLNLSKPPKLTLASSVTKAFENLELKPFNLILAMPGLAGMDVYDFGRQVKKRYPQIPFYLLFHNTCDINQYVSADQEAAHKATIDRTYIWGGNADLLLAIIKNFEDEKNVAFDTQNAKVRVIIMVEDSPYHYSSLLPVLYKHIVIQTQSVMDDSINEEHRLLKRRGRPKILLAHNYDQALYLFERYRPYVLSILTDMRYAINGQEDPHAGRKLLTRIKSEIPDLPVLILSTEEENRDIAAAIPAQFINKNSNNLHDQIKSFFVTHLGFGAFVFRMPDNSEIARASNLREVEKLLPDIPDASVLHHARHNDFSRWLLARSEVDFAMSLKPYTIDDFPDASEIKRFLIERIRARRKDSRQGLVIEFDPEKFDADTDFMKIGTGSLGGKARGLAFMSHQLGLDPSLGQKFPDIDISIPQTFIIATDGFKMFVEENKLSRFLEQDQVLDDTQVVERFLNAELPHPLKMNLRAYIQNVHYPVAVRSSSLFEDAHYQPFAGLYKTYMLPNACPGIEKRLERLITAVKLVYASTYLKAPRSYARSTMHRTEDEEMAVVLQQITGTRHKNYFYPSISGVAQSYNFYPIAHLKAEEGISYIALGLGKIVMDGGKTLRFCPKYPQFLPQFSMIDDILKNSQKYFYALKMDEFPTRGKIFGIGEDPCLARLNIAEAKDHPAVRMLCSTFNIQDNRIRDRFSDKGFPVLTFANILKYNTFPLADILAEVTALGARWMGTSVEVEFAVDLPVQGVRSRPRFSLLQIRPMGQYKQNFGVNITETDIKNAFCHSTLSLGNGEYKDIRDIVYVDPQTFEADKMPLVAGEINKINAMFNHTGTKYVLIGPGRWGSSDRWLGIPVVWSDISNVGVMVETTIESIKADFSQGSHFFQNITSLGISYITVQDKGNDFIDYDFLSSREPATATRYLKHIRFDRPVRILVDGTTSRAVIMQGLDDSQTQIMDDSPEIN